MRANPRLTRGIKSLWNKTVAMSYLEARATTDYVAFVDSDVLFAGEPEALVSGEFTACVHSTKHLASSGPEDARDPLWAQLCRVAKVELDDLPWVETHFDRARIRLYFNSGVFSYRRDSGFGQAWAQLCRALLDARVGPSDSKNHFLEQISLGLALVQAGLQWQPIIPVAQL